MAETAHCQQCGAPFPRRREHARFCSARCRLAWHRTHAGAVPPAVAALEWSVAAMREATARVAAARSSSPAPLIAAASETVWWITLVDATLIRYHHSTYDALLATLAPGERHATEGTLAGLRFVRNQMGYHTDPAAFLAPSGTAQPGTAQPGAGGWAWQPQPPPPVTALTPRARRWEHDRYHAYQRWLAGHTAADVFARAAAFLERAFASTTPASASHESQ